MLYNRREITCSTREHIVLASPMPYRFDSIANVRHQLPQGRIQAFCVRVQRSRYAWLHSRERRFQRAEFGMGTLRVASSVIGAAAVREYLLNGALGTGENQHEALSVGCREHTTTVVRRMQTVPCAAGTGQTSTITVV